MKKRISLLLAVIMLTSVLAMSGCKPDAGTPKDEPSELYTLVNESMEKTQAVTAYSAVMTQTIKQNLMGVTTENEAKINLKVSMADPNKPIIGLDGKMTLLGQQMTLAYYYDGTWMYVSVMGDGYKQKASMEEFQENTSGLDQFFTDLPKDLFDGVTAQTENGITKVELTADSEQFKAMYNELMSDLFNNVLGDNTSAVVVDDVKIVITLSNDYVKTYDMSFKCSYTTGSDSISFEVVQSLVFESINEEITITPPNGYEDFPEMNPG